MNADQPTTSRRDPNGPCACGSALPEALCCGARTLPGKQHPAVFAAGDSGDDTLDDWDLAVTALQALAAVLPDVPVPLLGSRSPRALYHAGPEERQAAIGFVQAVARSADGMGFGLPGEDIIRSLAVPESPVYSREDREKLALATFTLHLLARGVETAAVLGGHRLFRDLLRTPRDCRPLQRRRRRSLRALRHDEAGPQARLVRPPLRRAGPRLAGAPRTHRPRDRRR
jgi:hypothetical protein